MLFISDAYAQATDAAAAQPSLLETFFPFVFIIANMYFLIFRPQQKKFAEHKKLVESIKRGDNVITDSGIYGKVTKVDQEAEILHVEIASDVEIRISKNKVAGKTDKKTEEPDNTKTKKPAKKPAKKSK